MANDSAGPTTAKPNRITRWVLIAIGIYSALLVSFLNLLILNSENAKDRAIILMADGMIVLWIIVGGSLTPMLRRRLVPRIAVIPIDWRIRFVLCCTGMALLEEVMSLEDEIVNRHLAEFEGRSGVSHRVPWKQGILKVAKAFF